MKNKIQALIIIFNHMYTNKLRRKNFFDYKGDDS